MRKVLTVALVALFLFAGTGVLAVALEEAPDVVKPGEKGEADPFHDPDEDNYSGSGVTPDFTHEVTPDNPISVGG